MTDLAEIKKRAESRRVVTVPLRIDKTETRSDGKRRLVGHAAVWNSESEDLGGFVEVLRPNCFRQALAKNPRLLLVWNHNLDAPLARAPDTLEVSEDSEGLRFSATLPDTTTANDVYELASKGIADQCSFSFSVDDQGQEWTRSGGRVVRYINSVKELFELTICATPAYEASHVAARSSKRLIELRARAERAREANPTTTGTRGRLRVKERDPYGPDSEFSFFRDLAVVAAAAKHEHDAILGGQPWRVRGPRNGDPARRPRWPGGGSEAHRRSRRALCRARCRRPV
jgi:uncharacterized protein